jgi:hypothetical protein
VVYDNLFWNRTAKDLLHASVRSVGWNWGTLRELGGGGKDLASWMKGLATGKNPELSHRAAYAIALPITVGMLGAVTQYLYTGKGPETLEDYFHPRTGTKDADGNDNRVQLPTYMRDVFAWSKHPVQTPINKLNPLLSLTADMLQNKDYYGDEIRNADDPIMRQLAQTATFAGKESMPFVIQNVIEGKRRGMSLEAAAPAYVGITPASREVIRTPAQNMMAEIKRRHGVELTPEEAHAAQVRADLRQTLKTKGFEAAKSDLSKALREGTLTRQQVQATLKDDQTPGIVRRFKGLSLQDAERVYQAGNAREKAMWGPVLQGKRARAAGFR